MSKDFSQWEITHIQSFPIVPSTIAATRADKTTNKYERKNKENLDALRRESTKKFSLIILFGTLVQAYCITRWDILSYKLVCSELYRYFHLCISKLAN